MTLREFERVIWIASIACRPIIVWRILSLDLWPQYRWFAVWAGASFARSLVLVPLNPNRFPYFRIWGLTEPLLWGLSLLVLSEIASGIFRDLTGISSLGRKLVGIAAVVAAAVSWFVMAATWSDRGAMYRLFFLIERGVFSASVLFLLLLLVVVRIYPLPLNRQLVRHTLVLALYYLSLSVSLFYRTELNPGARELVSLVHTALGLAAYLAWIWNWLRRPEPAAIRPAPSSDRERRLLAQLEAVNSTLLGLRK
jgi:hypothetical protein